MRERYNSTSREIIVPFEVDMEMNNVTFTIPQRGEKKTLARSIRHECKTI